MLVGDSVVEVGERECVRTGMNVWSRSSLVKMMWEKVWASNGIVMGGLSLLDRTGVSGLEVVTLHCSHRQ